MHYYAKMETISSHWGINRWLHGIDEYINRCICCSLCGFNHSDKNRAYVYNDDSFSSDCCCIIDPYTCCCNNIITGTICFPLVFLGHILCLSCACCSPNRDMYYGTISPEKQKLDAQKERLERDEEVRVKLKKMNEESQAKIFAMSPEEQQALCANSYSYTTNNNSYVTHVPYWETQSYKYNDTMMRITQNNIYSNLHNPYNPLHL